jgi:hypothetical protein
VLAVCGAALGFCAGFADVGAAGGPCGLDLGGLLSRGEVFCAAYVSTGSASAGAATSVGSAGRGGGACTGRWSAQLASTGPATSASDVRSQPFMD